VRLAVFDQRALIHNDDLVEVENCVELVRHSDYGVRRKFLAEEALHGGVGGSVKAGGALVWARSGDDMGCLL
jgi:hypothetical protein